MMYYEGRKQSGILDLQNQLGLDRLGAKSHLWETQDPVNQIALPLNYHYFQERISQIIVLFLAGGFKCDSRLVRC